MENDKTIAELNDLLQITNDRLQGFQEVEKKVMESHPHLKVNTNTWCANPLKCEQIFPH